MDSFCIDDHLEINFDTNNISPKYDLDVLNSLCPERDPITPGEIIIAGEWFKNKSNSQSFRGKQNAHLLYKLYTFLCKAATSGVTPFHRPIKMSRNISLKHIISDLSVYADTPPVLVEFLRNTRDEFSK